MFSTKLKRFDFCCRFWAKWFFGFAEIQLTFLKIEDLYQKFGRPLYGTHPLVYISKLSFPETPKTVIGGDKVRESF